MPSYPIIDQIGAAILLIAFIALLDAEKGWPLRHRVDRWRRRILVNVGIAVPSFLVLRLLLIPVVVAVAGWAQSHHLGLVRMIPMPPILAAIVSFLVLDYSMYLWHRLNHGVPFFWRFHHVHHTDLDLDVSTAFRFHFGEMLLSVIVRSIQVVVSGASPMTVLVYEVLLEVSTEFHHSNIRLPRLLDRTLSWLIMTPRAHGIHHSSVVRERNTNFSNFLILWDRLHRTLKLNIRQEDIVIGVPEYREPGELTAGSLLAMPFRRQRPPVPWNESSVSPEIVAARGQSGAAPRSGASRGEA